MRYNIVPHERKTGTPMAETTQLQCGYFLTQQTIPC